MAQADKKEFEKAAEELHDFTLLYVNSSGSAKGAPPPPPLDKEHVQALTKDVERLLVQPLLEGIIFTNSRIKCKSPWLANEEQLVVRSPADLC